MISQKARMFIAGVMTGSAALYLILKAGEVFMRLDRIEDFLSHLSQMMSQ